MAVNTLPAELFQFYKSHLDFITEHAVDPDKRRYALDGEDVKHFIDIDHYGVYPFNNVPRYWNEAIKVIDQDTLETYGILPYSLPREMYKLTKAFKEKDLVRILKLSSDIGHYIGDSHVPLHTTENYNGQMTGQKGIHGFWESRLPELFGSDYNFFVGRAYYIDNVEMEIWDAVLESHNALDSVLSFERMLNEQFSPDKKYGYESRNNITVRAYSREYAGEYHDMLNGQVERRMRRSIHRIGAFWYTAWKNAGSPDLSELIGKKVKLRQKVKYKKRLKVINREGNGLSFFRNMRTGQQHLYADCCCKELDGATSNSLNFYELAALNSARKEVEMKLNISSTIDNEGGYFSKVWLQLKNWYTTIS